MESLVFEETGSRVTARQTFLPTPNAGEIVIDIESTGVCGTDFGAIRSGRPEIQPGTVMGHEIMGFSPDLSSQVAVNPIITCGTCNLCRLGRTELCVQRQVMGVHRHGGFARHVVVPVSNVVSIAPSIAKPQLAFSEPLATALHAWRESEAKPGARVGVIGGGAIGTALVLIARSMGASLVAVAERDESRRHFPREAGSDWVGESLQPQGFDVVFDCVGTTATRNSALSVIEPGGTVLLSGLSEVESSFNAFEVVSRGTRIQGAFGYTDDEFRQVFTLDLPVKESWVRRVDFNEAIDILNGEKPIGNTLKMHVVPN